MGSRIFRIGLLAAVLTQGGPLPGHGQPLAPAAFRLTVTINPPDPTKWIAAATGTGRIFRCKPHACREPVAVSFTFEKRPLKAPDPQALQKFATIELPKAIRAEAVARTVMTGIVERIETLSSEADMSKGYPSALNETKFTKDGIKSTFLDTRAIFADPLLIRIQSTSANRRLAYDSLRDFVKAMKIGTAPPASRPFLPQSQTQSL